MAPEYCAAAASSFSSFLPLCARLELTILISLRRTIILSSLLSKFLCNRNYSIFYPNPPKLPSPTCRSNRKSVHRTDFPSAIFSSQSANDPPRAKILSVQKIHRVQKYAAYRITPRLQRRHVHISATFANTPRTRRRHGFQPVSDFISFRILFPYGIFLFYLLYFIS